MSEIEKILFILKETLMNFTLQTGKELLPSNSSSLQINTTSLQTSDLIFYINQILKNINHFKSYINSPFFINSLYNIKTFRNLWAHQSNLTINDYYRFLDDCSLVINDLSPSSEGLLYVNYHKDMVMKRLLNETSINNSLSNKDDAYMNIKVRLLEEEVVSYKSKVEFLTNQIFLLKNEKEKDEVDRIGQGKLGLSLKNEGNKENNEKEGFVYNDFCYFDSQIQVDDDVDLNRFNYEDTVMGSGFDEKKKDEITKKYVYELENI